MTNPTPTGAPSPESVAAAKVERTDRALTNMNERVLPPGATDERLSNEWTMVEQPDGRWHLVDGAKTFIISQDCLPPVCLAMDFHNTEMAWMRYKLEQKTLTAANNARIVAALMSGELRQNIVDRNQGLVWVAFKQNPMVFESVVEAIAALLVTDEVADTDGATGCADDSSVLGRNLRGVTHQGVAVAFDAVPDALAAARAEFEVLSGIRRLLEHPTMELEQFKRGVAVALALAGMEAKIETDQNSS